MDKVPFDPYDFFGYLASGLAIVIGMELSLGFPSVLNAQLSFVQSACLILAVYVAGHLIANPSFRHPTSRGAVLRRRIRTLKVTKSTRATKEGTTLIASSSRTATKCAARGMS
jgi:hypothetical protein